MQAKPVAKPDQSAEIAPEILFEVRGEAGIVTLNRPRALNALSMKMVRALHPQLDRWAEDPTITRVIIMAAGEKAFCAGGDIRELYDLGKQGHFPEALQFWKEEYRLNRAIKRYPKPYISLIDGIVMGGGFGLSAHGQYRIAGDRYLFAMPEVGIGFFPDVGATYVLPRLPGMTGTYLAVTGARIGAGDALALGLVTSTVQSLRIPALVEELVTGADVDRTLRKYLAPQLDVKLDANRALIHAAFSEVTIGAIVSRLLEFGEAGSVFARDTARNMQMKSPTSMAIALEQMRRGPALSFEEAMVLEYRIVSRLGAAVDFFEGVRAALIDKDQKPVWSPSRIEDVSEAEIAAYFAPTANHELSFS